MVISNSEKAMCFLLEEIEERDCKKFAKFLIEQFDQKGNNKKILQKQLEARSLKCIQSKNITILIATEQAQIKGYLIMHWIQELWTDNPEAIISSFYVAIHSRNIGVGKLLLKGAVQKAKDNSCSRLWLENNRNNPIYVKQFYKNRGWNERLDLAVFEFPL